MSRMLSILGFAVAAMAIYATATHAATWEDPVGAHAPTVVASTGPGGRYYVHRPGELKPGAHPIAVLCAGSGAHPRSYDPMMAALASHGVVVIADAEGFQGDGDKASAAVDWLVSQNEAAGSEYFHKLVPSKVLAIGHSSGGNGAIWAAAMNRRVTSVLLYAPAVDSARPSDLSVPTLFISGDLDGVVLPAAVKARYQEVTKAGAWYAEAKDQAHTGFVRNASVQYFTRAWAYTHLFDDQAGARATFYGPGWTLANAPRWNETLRNGIAP